MRQVRLRTAKRPLLAALALVAAFASHAQAADPAGTGVEPDVQAPAAATQSGNSAADYSLSAIVRQVREGNERARQQLAAREAKFKARLDDAQSRLAQARDRLQQGEAEGRRLERRFDANKVELNDKAQLLKDKIGALKELFGVFQQNASDLIGAFVGSPTSLQYPDRDQWLEGFANRMKNASEVSSADDIKRLWFEMQREIVATSDIVRLRAAVRGTGGAVTERDIVRVGAFNLVTVDPRPEYLAWDAGRQQAAELPRQPAGPFPAEIDEFVGASGGVHMLSTDPTGGVLMSLLIEKPSLRERIDQGGLVGYMILGLGAVSLVLAVLKLLDIALISLRVGLQRRRPDAPSAGNSLGRLLLVYRDNRHVDSETLEMRLHDQVRKEDGRINRFTVFLAIIAAVTPLMGLLGTVVGMINTFQAITLYGTGDPQTMAGGISQALITTVLGLVVAVPAVLLHAVVGARGKAVVMLLRQHSAALTGDRLQVQADRGGSIAPDFPAAAVPA